MALLLFSQTTNFRFVAFVLLIIMLSSTTPTTTAFVVSSTPPVVRSSSSSTTSTQRSIASTDFVENLASLLDLGDDEQLPTTTAKQEQPDAVSLVSEATTEADLVVALQDQIQRELDASHRYMTASEYCEQVAVDNKSSTGRLLVQHLLCEAEEQRMRALQLMEFAKAHDWDVTVTPSSSTTSSSSWSSLHDMVMQLLQAERADTVAIQTLRNRAALQGQEELEQHVLKQMVEDQLEQEADLIRMTSQAVPSTKLLP